MILTRSEKFWHLARNWAETVFVILLAFVIMAGMIYGLIVIVEAAAMALRNFFR